jgi:2-polyprenyl-3-methyl-5-hydroxy-6-metoxy-1,4-benzoquinol methylase
MAIKTTQSTNRLRFIPLAFGSLLASWIVCAADLPSAVGQEKIEQLPEAGSVEEQREDLEIGGVNRTKYMGRRIADTMGYLGAPWLIRETRELEENPTVVLEQLGLKPGMSVCDLGCGNGFYTLLMAQKVGPTGKVYAVDIQPEMLQLLSRRAVEAKIDQIDMIHSTVKDAKLPEGKVDLLLLVDVYHEFSHPEEMLASIRKSLSPEGVIALVEFRGEDPRVPIKPLHKMTKKQILKEYQANGFRLVREFDGLPIQHLMFFGIDETWKPADKDTNR